MQQPKPKYARRQLVVYPRLQWMLLGYSVAGMITTALIVLRISRLFTVDGDYQLNPTAIAMTYVGLLGLICGWLVIGLYLTNRIFGPLFRLHKEIRAWKTGNSTHPIKLRDGDHFQELIADFNELMQSQPGHRESTPNP